MIRRKYASLVNSRGCPYKCICCHTVFGKKIRARCHFPYTCVCLCTAQTRGCWEIRLGTHDRHPIRSVRPRLDTAAVNAVVSLT